ncbi:MAG: 5-oxoprolinase subunit PxpA [Clostridia bacterium]|nr:5-oxoprolinase subunit PxpA [Clostridia bacterium]MBQ7046735.1 5-oxoprolinase subunit PxpA [Oscillospiraceae bacterium]
MKKVDLNCDLGESFGNYKLGLDEEVIKYISSANVACGFHASDPLVMQKTVSLAKEFGVCVGAHPGFPDLVGFGRRNMNVSPQEAKAFVQYQIGALDAFCKASGTKLCHVKPHGALYNMAGKDEALANAICEGIYEYNRELILLCLSGSKMIDAAKNIGLRAASEVFADRAYEDDGSLVARSKPGAVITDEDIAVSRVVEMVKKGSVRSINGNTVEIKADSICLHGDGIKAVEFAKRIRVELQNNDVEIVSLNELI